MRKQLCRVWLMAQMPLLNKPIFLLATELENWQLVGLASKPASTNTVNFHSSISWPMITITDPYYGRQIVQKGALFVLHFRTLNLFTSTIAASFPVIHVDLSKGLHIPNTAPIDNRGRWCWSFGKPRDNYSICHIDIGINSNFTHIILEKLRKPHYILA